MKTNFIASCTREQLKEIRQFLSKELARTHLSDSEQHQIILAVDEACANAIIHGNQCNCTKSIKLNLEISEDDLVIEISDIGNYRPNEIKWQSRDIATNIRERQKGGLGLKLIHKIMDNVSYFKRDKINICSLTKHLK